LDGGSALARPLPTHTTTQTSMLSVGFKPTISLLERGKTAHVSDRAVAVIGRSEDSWYSFVSKAESIPGP
jgi:hypothetical protein